MRASKSDEDDDDEEMDDECEDEEQDQEDTEEDEEEQEEAADEDEDSQKPSVNDSKEMTESRPHGLGPCDSEEELKDGQLAINLASHDALDPAQDSQAPLLRRYRSKKSLESLQSQPSKEVLPTPASYAKAMSPSKEQELALLMQQIAMFEDAQEQKPEHTRHDAMLLLMGSPPKQGDKSEMSSEGKGI